MQHNSKLETSGIGETDTMIDLKNVTNPNLKCWINAEGIKDGTDYEWIDFLFWIDDQYEICRKEHKTDYVLPNIFNSWLYKKYLGETA